MKRYSKAYLARAPGEERPGPGDHAQACAKFSRIPVAVFSFLEGTRFTRAKHDEQQSPFRHLLKPKAGGIAFVLDAMGNNEDLVNVTIHYPDGSPTFWCLLSGRLKDVVVRFEELEIPRQFVGKATTRTPATARNSSNGSTSCGAQGPGCSTACTASSRAPRRRTKSADQRP